MRRTMTSVRGFRAPRPSGEHPAPPSPASAMDTEPRGGEHHSERATSTPRTSSQKGGRASATVAPARAVRGSPTASRQPAVALDGPQTALGGHFSANRVLMTRRSARPPSPPYPPSVQGRQPGAPAGRSGGAEHSTSQPASVDSATARTTRPVESRKRSRAALGEEPLSAENLDERSTVCATSRVSAAAHEGESGQHSVLHSPESAPAVTASSSASAALLSAAPRGSVFLLAMQQQEALAASSLSSSRDGADAQGSQSQRAGSSSLRTTAPTAADDPPACLGSQTNLLDDAAGPAVALAPGGVSGLALVEEDEDALAREVEEDLRLSADVAFTPLCAASYGGRSGGGASSGTPSSSQPVNSAPRTAAATPRGSTLDTILGALSPSLGSPCASQRDPVAAQSGVGAASDGPPIATAGGHSPTAAATAAKGTRTVFKFTAVARSPPPGAAAGAQSTALAVREGEVADAEAAGEHTPQAEEPLPPPTVCVPLPAADASSPPLPPLQLFLGAASEGIAACGPPRTRFTFTASHSPAAASAADDAPFAPGPTGPAPGPCDTVEARASSPAPTDTMTAAAPAEACAQLPGAWYDLPDTVRHLFATRRGVKSLYEWQHALLTRPDVRRGENFVYSMPTSGGKTLVAEVTVLRCLLNRRKSAFFVVPFVALAEEKTLALRPFGEVLDFAVDGHYGSSGRFPVPPAPTLFVCTIEKANSLLNHLLEEGRGDELGAVVVDELHMVGEPRRGATLELFLSKLLLLSARQQQQRQQQQSSFAPDDDVAEPAEAPLQIVGMSATVPNMPAIAAWLHAALHEGTERPVPLRQYSVVDGLVLRDGDGHERSLTGRTEAEQLLELASELPDASVLIFCASRQQCVDTARGLVLHAKRSVAADCPNYTTAVEGMQGVLRPETSAGVQALVDELHGLASYSEAALLADVVPFGVAFHHGGLLAEEREAIETAYRSRLVRVLCCTSTLAAGVNLPARRVVFKTPYIGREFLTKSRYLQMCGRAGRAGLDAYGESFLILSRRDRDRGHRLMHQEMEPCLSQLLEDASNLPRSLLECVAVGLVGTGEQTPGLQWGASLLASTALGSVATAFVPPLQARIPGPEMDSHAAAGASGSRNAADGSNEREERSLDAPPTPLTAVSAQPPQPDASGAQRPAEYLQWLRATHAPSHIVRELLAHSLSVLVDSGLAESVSVVPATDTDAADTPAAPAVRATPFGSSAVRSCFSVEEALLVRDELEHLRETGLILSDDLHLCYFLTPLREVGDCDWRTYSGLLSQLNDSRQRIAMLLGINEQLIHLRAMGLGGGRGSHDVPSTEAGKRDFFSARRFFVALMLSDVLSEVPIDEVEVRYNVKRGQLQSLMRSASMFSSSITSFCHAMEWFSLEAVLASFVKRLGFGVKPDLVPLMEVRNVQPARARALWNAGYKSPKHLAACEDADEMVHRVKTGNPPDSKSARFFTRRSALALIREASLLLESQIREKRDELQQLAGSR